MKTKKTKKEDWEVKKLGDVCDTGAGGTPLKFHKEYYENGTIPWLRSGEVSKKYITNSELFITQQGLDNSSAKSFPENTVLVAMYGATAGQVGILKFQATTNQAVCGILPNENMVPEFLYYFFTYEKENLVKQAVGGAQPNISQIKIRNTKIPVLKVEEQKRIVGILDGVFADIEKAREVAEKNLANAKELFESYLQSVFQKNKNTWVEKILGDEEYFKIIDGDRGKNYPKKKDFLPEGYCLFMNTKNVRENGFRFETTMFINKHRDELLGNGKLKRDDVVLTTRGTIGNVGLYSSDVKYDHIRINSGMLIFRVSQNKILPEYLFKLFQSSIMKSQIRKHVSGAAQPQLPIKTLVNFIIPFPKSLTEQKQIVAKLDALSGEVEKLEEILQSKIAGLDELKKSVLKKAFDGEL